MDIQSKNIVIERRSHCMGFGCVAPKCRSFLAQPSQGFGGAAPQCAGDPEGGEARWAAVRSEGLQPFWDIEVFPSASCTFLPTCLAACCVPAYLHACLLAYLRACLSAFTPARLRACIPRVCISACPQSSLTPHSHCTLQVACS